ncbi:MAG: TRAP transporter substrate-binding protein [bacterium]|nr:TRAP transporter substrate-binding protein [bacterium]
MIVCLVVALTLVGITFGNSSEAAKALKVAISHGSTLEHPIEKASVEFAKIVDGEAGDRFEVKSFPNGSLYQDNWEILLEMLQTGATQIGVESITAFGSVVNGVSAMQLPFMFQSDAHIKKFLETDSEIVQRWNAMFEEKNLVILGMAPRTFRQLINNKHLIKTPADIKGMKFRVPENPFFVRIFELFGAKPVPMPSSEIYSSIQLGTVVGEDNSISNVYDDKTHEVAKYMTLWYYIADGDMLVANKDFFYGLSEDDQALFRKAAKEWVRVRTLGGDDFEQHARKQMEEAGVQYHVMSAEEKVPFKELVSPMYDETKEQVGEENWKLLMEALESTK